MSGEQAAFEPLYIKSGPGQTGTLAPSVTVAATDAGVASAVLPGSNGNNFTQLQIANVTAGTSWAYVNLGRFGSVTAATVATGFPIAPNSVIVITVDPEVNGAHVIMGTAAATANVIFTRGQGL